MATSTQVDRDLPRFIHRYLSPGAGDLLRLPQARNHHCSKRSRTRAIGADIWLGARGPSALLCPCLLSSRVAHSPLVYALPPAGPLDTPCRSCTIRRHLPVPANLYQSALSLAAAVPSRRSVDPHPGTQPTLCPPGTIAAYSDP